MPSTARKFVVALLSASVAGILAEGPVSAALVASPSRISVPGGQATTVAVTYRFSGLVSRFGGGYSGPMSSPSGEFRIGRGIVIPVPTVVTATVQGGAGAVTETLTVPVQAIDAARRQGVTSFTYERTFTDTPAAPFLTEPVSIPVSVTSEAAAAFGIQRIELYFDNRRGETTVPRNRRGLKAYADVRFTGSGLLTGFWEVDGRRILDVNQPLSFGTGVTLSTPDSPDLPTFDTGTHIVRFVVTHPSFPIGLPQAVYYVTPSEGPIRAVKIRVPPAPPGGAEKGTRSFEWDRPPGIDLFLLVFSETPNGKPIFSAFSKGNRYTLPSTGMEGVFTAGHRYYWWVNGYDRDENQVGESEPAEFTY